MANKEHLERLAGGIEEWNDWRSSNPEIIPDLRGADLRKKDLSGSSFLWIDLSGVDLREADLSDSILMGVDLSGAQLQSARLWGIHLYQTRLRNANLTDATLAYCTLRWTNLTGANLSGARLIGSTFAEAALEDTVFHRAICQRTIFADVDLSSAIGLNEIVHSGPSAITFETIIRSRGLIPLEFLRRSGVPEKLISLLPRIVRETADTPDVHVRVDKSNISFARKLAFDLQFRDFRVWLERQVPDDIEMTLAPIDFPLPSTTIELPIVALEDWVVDEDRIRADFEWTGYDLENRVTIPIFLAESRKVLDLFRRHASELNLNPLVILTASPPSTYRAFLEKLIRRLRRGRDGRPSIPIVALLGRFSGKRAQIQTSLVNAVESFNLDTYTVDLSKQTELESTKLTAAFELDPSFLLVELALDRQYIADIARLAESTVVAIQPIISSVESDSLSSAANELSRLFGLPWVLPLIKYDDLTDLDLKLRSESGIARIMQTSRLMGENETGGREDA